MTDWHLRVEYPHTVDADDKAEILGAQLVEAGVLTATMDRGRGRVAVAVIVQAGTVRAATDEGLRRTDEAMRAAGITARAVRVAVMTAEDVEAELRRPMLPKLVGATEGAAILRITKQRFGQLASERDDFPIPVAELAAGRVYTEDSVRAFDARWERRVGRPPKPPKPAE